MSRPLHVALIVPPRTSGGGLVFYRELAQALAADPDAVRLTLCVTTGSQLDQWPPGTERVHIAPSRFFDRSPWSASSRSLRRALSRITPDVVLCAGTHAPYVGRYPLVLWPLTVAPFERETVALLCGSARDRVRWWLVGGSARLASRQADGLIFSSRYAQSCYTAASRTAAAKPSAVILPAVSLHDLTSDDRAGKRDFLFVSHLYPYKMVCETMRAFDAAIEDGSIAGDLLIAGAAPNESYRERIASTHASLNHPDRIRLLGQQNSESLKELYLRARAFIFPSMSENAGSYALIDAFAAGLPVLSSNRSSMPEICGSGAIFFDPTEPAELTPLIRRVALDDAFLEELAVRSRENFRRFPTWEVLGTQTIAFMNALIAPSEEA